jgi:hypothetical protein
VASTYCIDYIVQLCKRPHRPRIRALQSAVPTSHSRHHGPSFHQPRLNPHILNKAVRSVGSVRSPNCYRVQPRNYTKSSLSFLSFELANTRNSSYSFEALVASRTGCVLTNTMDEKQISVCCKQATSLSRFQFVCCRASCARQTCKAVAIFLDMDVPLLSTKSTSNPYCSQNSFTVAHYHAPYLVSLFMSTRHIRSPPHRHLTSPHLTRGHLPYYITPTPRANLSKTGPRNAPQYPVSASSSAAYSIRLPYSLATRKTPWTDEVSREGKLVSLPRIEIAQVDVDVSCDRSAESGSARYA